MDARVHIISVVIMAISLCVGCQEASSEDRAVADVRDISVADGDASARGDALDGDSQDGAQPLVLPACALAEAFDEAGLAGRDSGGYRSLNATQRLALGESIEAFVRGDMAGVVSRSEAASYEVCVDATARATIWRPEAGSGRAIIAVREAATRALILEAPHPLHDSGTLAQARVLFERLGARGLIVSGAHRCASAEASSCDGSTSVCTGSPSAYPLSDMAHVVDSAFERAHEALSEGYPTARVLSLHGFTSDGVSLSDGTTLATDAGAPVASLAASLRETFAGAYITTCNDYPGATVDARLCGTTNVQGRHLNGAANACIDAASVSGGRFVHMEQSRATRDDLDGVTSALEQWLPATPSP